MTNIKGFENFKAPALKTGQNQSSGGAKPTEDRQSFKSQLKDAADTAGSKAPETQKPSLKPGQNEEEETKAENKLPTEGLPVTDITMPIPTDESGAADLLQGLTEQSAAVISELKSADGQSLLLKQMQPLTGAEAQGISAETEAQLKAMTTRETQANQQILTNQETQANQQTQVKQDILVSQEAPVLTKAAKLQSDGAKPETEKPVLVQDTQPSTERTTAGQPQTKRTDAPPHRQGQNMETAQNTTAANTVAAKTADTGAAAKASGAEGGSIIDMADVKILSVSGQPEETAELNKTAQSTELIQDVTVLKQDGTETETIVKIKVAEPYKTLDTEVVKQLAAKITDKAAAGGKELIIQLTPEHLGRISIKIAAESDGVRIVLGCENQKTMNLLADKAAGIAHIVEDNLNQQAVVEIKEDGYWNQQKNATDQNSKQNQGQQDEQRNGDRHQDETDNFIQQLRLGMQRNEEAV